MRTKLSKFVRAAARSADDLLLLLGAAALGRAAFLRWGEATAWAVAGAYCIVMALLLARGGRRK